MTRQVKGTKYRKFKSPNASPGTRRPGYAGRVHLMFYERESREWRFVCGKREGTWGARGDVVDDETPVTCLNCAKHAPDVVEIMDVLDELDYGD